ncbi:HIT-like domain-containing protein [Syncephalis pseudoplumigaleata]|uniref:HIT-like domain-containing protein n=1 Tax=Syncephalis pseudoplumigaleata TaxID=1712513 RepID=A0A4P9Z4L4_9FUNG|nr:HIT-like domain-containing protein [Syncephalis pseudoplumigaleata]|eukprot:RKP26510.1 HIT-like domain-containing protein [Syncephalis pseudoplumigaleata]
MTFESCILAVHNEALASGALVFTQTTTEVLYQDGVAFNVRLAPSLASKPTGNTEAVGVQRAPPSNPFLPYDRALLVEELKEHVVLLNKYCVIPGHIILATKAFVPQTNPPDVADFTAVWYCMRRAQTRPFITFYNCGKESGASQPHKHLQLLPMESDDINSPPIFKLIEQVPSHPDVPFRVPEFKFVHACAHLSLDTTVIAPDAATGTPQTPEQHDAATGRALHRTFLSLANAVNLNLGAVPEDDAFQSYNLILTRHFMLLVPRKHESVQSVPVNSLGLAGLFLAKSHEQMNILKHSSILQLYQALTFPVDAEADGA